MTFKNELEIHLDDAFPKGDCEERGNALVLFAYALMLHDKLIAEARTDEALRCNLHSDSAVEGYKKRVIEVIDAKLARKDTDAAGLLLSAGLIYAKTLIEGTKNEPVEL